MEHASSIMFDSFLFSSVLVTMLSSNANYGIAAEAKGEIPEVLNPESI